MNDRSQTDKNEMSDYPLQLEILWAYRLISKNLNSLLLIVFLGISASLFIALTTPEVYRAEMVIKSAGDKNKSMFSQISNQLSGIAGSLGMNIGEQSGQSYSSSVATLYSRVFLQNFILDKNLMKDLFPEDWDHDSNSWKDPEAKPTMQDAYEVFSERIFLNRNEKTGIIDFAFEWSDPDIAASLANDLIFSVNSYLRNKEIANISSNIEYLEKELTQTSIVNAQAVVFKVIEEQTKAIMMANVAEEYAFEIIDPAVSPEERIKPSRRLIMIIGALASFALGLTIILLKEYLPKYFQLLQLDSKSSSQKN